MKKILIVYASYGSGHKTIAQYIKDTIYDENKYQIELIDVLSYTGRVADFVLKSFDYAYKHRMEKLFSSLYEILDHHNMTKGYEWYVRKFIFNDKLRKMYIDFNPDVVIATHFYGTTIAKILKGEGLINPRMVTVVTDYKIHELWMSNSKKEDIFIVANNIVKNEMIERGCKSEHIEPLGLPYNEKKLIEIIPRNEIYDKYDIPKDKKNILFYGGGSMGSFAYVKYLKVLLKLNTDYEILFVCGKNTELKEYVDDLSKKYNNLKPFGFVNNVYELMDISDIIISKPGGATVTECLEMQKFLVALPGIGGQENYNARFVSENGYGVRVRYLFTFKLFMKKYLFDSERYINAYKNKKVDNQSLAKIKKLINDITK